MRRVCCTFRGWKTPTFVCHCRDMTSASAATRLIEFRNAYLGLTVAALRTLDAVQLADDLHKRLGGMPSFFSGEGLLLDCAQLDQVPDRPDWAGVLSLLRRHELQPVGLINLPDSLREGARRAGLAVIDTEALSDALPTVAAQQAPGADIAARAEPEPAPPDAPASIPAGTLFVEKNLRSGQQVYARGGDLVVVGDVSNGAEVLADGCIHCFGALRGRAIAGAQGDVRARIIANRFGAELVSIAGVYQTFENGIPPRFAGRGTEVRLDKDPSGTVTLVLNPISHD